MKKITAVIREEQVDDVENAMHEMEISITASNSKGFIKSGETVEHRGNQYACDFVPKIKLEIVVLDSQVEAVINAIMTAARTGKSGDGKIWIEEISEAYRIRTGESGEVALLK